MRRNFTSFARSTKIMLSLIRKGFLMKRKSNTHPTKRLQRKKSKTRDKEPSKKVRNFLLSHKSASSKQTLIKIKNQKSKKKKMRITKLFCNPWQHRQRGLFRQISRLSSSRKRRKHPQVRKRIGERKIKIYILKT